MRARLGIVGPVAAVAVLAGCGGATSAPAADPATPAASPSPSATSTAPEPAPETAPEPKPGTVPPPWLGTRELPTQANGFGEVRRTPPALRERRFTLPDTVAPLPGPGFASDVVSPAPRRVIERSTWEPGCPVAADELSWVRLSFRGFDGERHTGELLTHTDVVDDVVQVFDALWRADFPIEEMRVTRRAELEAAPTGDGNNTGSFVCRPVVGGSSTPSQHASGLAVDLNPFQNPYLRDGDVLPELASSYLDRDRVRPGMILEGGPAVRAFDEIGWSWGGRYRTLLDLHHFSLTGG
jgi:hypothetical protein